MKKLLGIILLSLVLMLFSVGCGELPRSSVVTRDSSVSKSTLEQSLDLSSLIDGSLTTSLDSIISINSNQELSSSLQDSFYSQETMVSTSFEQESNLSLQDSFSINSQESIISTGFEQESNLSLQDSFSISSQDSLISTSSFQEESSLSIAKSTSSVSSVEDSVSSVVSSVSSSLISSSSKSSSSSLISRTDIWETPGDPL